MKLLVRLALVIIASHFVFAGDRCDVQPQPGIDVVAMFHPPVLPLVLHDVLPGESWALGSWRVRNAIPIYNSWEPGGRVVAKLRTGSTVTALEGLNVIHKPDAIVMTETIPAIGLEIGDKLLRYRNYGEGEADYWARSCWFKDLGLAVREASGGGCRRSCTARVTEPGSKTWWFKLRLHNGMVGWSNDYRNLSLAENTPSAR